MTTPEEWVAEWRKKHGVGVMMCRVASTDLQKAFPHLLLKRGWAHLGFGKYQHWWCEDRDGTIYDPTSEQWGRPIIHYEEYDLALHGPEPIGKCMNCGAYCFKDSSPSQWACTEECQTELEVHYNGERI